MPNFITVDSASPNPVTGTDQDDDVTLNGNASGFVLNLLAGDDAIEAGVQVGNGGYFSNTVVNFDDGADVLGSAIFNTKTGTYIINDGGIGAGSIVYGNQGEDNLNFNNSADSSISVYGGQDNDSININAGTTFVVQGNLGDDTVLTGKAVSLSTVYGGQGEDIINDRGTQNIVYGNKGDDAISSDGVGTKIYGGQGDDVIRSYTDFEDGETFPFGSSQVIYGNVGNDKISAVNSTVYGGQGNDNIEIVAGNTSLAYGNIGDDTINLSGGESTGYGGKGNDTLIGYGAEDVLYGNLGDDTFNVASPAEGLTGPQSATIGDFVTGFDEVNIGGGTAVGGAGGNYSEVSNNQITNAQQAAAAAVSGQEYTFVAGATDGYLVYTVGSTTLTATLAGLNSEADFAASDIQGNLSQSPNTP